MNGNSEALDATSILFVLEDVEGREAPFVPTPSWLLNSIARIVSELAEKHLCRVYYEPGCGDGRAAEVITRQLYPPACICLEIDPKLAATAHRRLPLCDVVVGDLSHPPLRELNMIVYSYLLPAPTRKVIESIRGRAVVVSLEYKPEGLEGREYEKIVIDGPFTEHIVYVYLVERLSGAQRASVHRPA